MGEETPRGKKSLVGVFCMLPDCSGDVVNGIKQEIRDVCKKDVTVIMANFNLPVDWTTKEAMIQWRRNSGMCL